MQCLELLSASTATSELRRHLARAEPPGLLLFWHDDPAGALSGLKSIAEGLTPNTEKQVLPAACPEATRLLYKLAKRITKAHLQRLGRHSYELHAFFDDFEALCSPFAPFALPGAASSNEVQCKLLASNSRPVREHVDTGLLNLVLGTRHDLSSLYLRLGDKLVSAGDLLPAVDEEALLLLAMPGYTLQCLDPATPAISHTVPFAAGVGKCRSSVVFQWRLHPDFLIGDTSVGQLLADFVSVRAPEVCMDGAHCEPPTLPPAPKYKIKVQTISGKPITINAHPEWTAGNLKDVLKDREGFSLDQQRFVFAGKQLFNQDKLSAANVKHGDTVHLMLK